MMHAARYRASHHNICHSMAESFLQAAKHTFYVDSKPWYAKDCCVAGEAQHVQVTRTTTQQQAIIIVIMIRMVSSLWNNNGNNKKKQ